MTIFIGSDHAGFELKEKLISFLKGLNFNVIDAGPFEFNPEDDYPDFCFKVAKSVNRNPEEDKGIVIGGSGQGEAIVSNRVKNIRAIVYYGGNLEIIKLGRQHNNANILSLGARFISFEEAKEAVKMFLETEFSKEERHIRRIKKIDLLI